MVTFTEAPAPGDVISSRYLALSVTAGMSSSYGLVTIKALDEGVLITGANSTISANSVLFKSDGTVGWNGTVQTAVDTSPVLIHTFDAGRYRSAKYVIQVENATANAYEASDVMVIHNGSYAYRTQYNMISTFANAAALGSVTAAYAAGNVNLYYQGITVGNRVKVRADMIGNDQPWEPF